MMARAERARTSLIRQTIRPSIDSMGGGTSADSGVSFFVVISRRRRTWPYIDKSLPLLSSRGMVVDVIARGERSRAGQHSPETGERPLHFRRTDSVAT